MSDNQTNHDVCFGFHKVIKCFHNLISAFGPFEVCVTLFICLLHRRPERYGMNNRGKVEDGLTCIICGTHPEPFNPEPQAGGGAQCLPPLHVPCFQHCLLSPLLCGWCLRIHRDHLLIHVLAGLWPFSRNLQLILEVCAVENSASVPALSLGKYVRQYKTGKRAL